MPVVRILRTAEHTQVEGFPKGTKEKPFKRSCDGALHIRPGSTKVITEDELGFIKARHPELHRRILVVAKDRPAKGPAKTRPKGPAKGLSGATDSGPPDLVVPPGGGKPDKASPEGVGTSVKGSKGKK